MHCRAVLLLLTIAGCGLAQSDVAHPPAWHASQLNVEHSDVALMPEGTPPDYALFRAVSPTVVAWGEDALAALDGGPKAAGSLRARTREYEEIGVTSIATNVWMLTATERYLHSHPELAEATCVDLWGNKIVPGWLGDADFEGTKPWWGCTNNPRYQAHLLARLRAGLAAGATMVHLDDHSGTFACAADAGGCFCRYCLAGFRAWLKANVAPGALRIAGVHDVDTFDYRTFLLHHGYASREEFVAQTRQGRVELWPWFLAYQRSAALAVIARLQDAAEKDVGHRVPFGVNAWNLAPTQLFDAHRIDYFANEVEQFGKEDTVPPVAYRLGEALGRPIFATGTGDDWVAFHQTRAVTRVRGWIAEAYAFGQYFMYAWKKWGFSQDTGTLWTEVDPEVFAPMCAFIRAHPELFDQMENTATTGLLYDNAAAARNHWAVRNAARALLDAGVPFRLVVNGDDQLRTPLRPESFTGLQQLVVPDDIVHTAKLDAALSSWTATGGKIISGPAKPETPPDTIAVQASGRVWALPRKHVAHSTERTGGARHRDEAPAPALVVHLLNRDYGAAGDRYARQTAFRITLNPAALGGPAVVKRVLYFQPQAKPRALEPSVTNGRITVAVPSLDIWGILEFE